MRAHPQQTRDRAIEALLLGQTIEEAAEYARIGRRTLHRWLAEDDTFRKQLDDSRQKLFDLHVAALAQMTGTAIRKLRAILEREDVPVGVLLRAIEVTIKQARDTEEHAIREVLAELRDAIQRERP